MGINTFNISAERKALELTCDSPSHHGNAPRAWFDCGSLSGCAWLAVTAGWNECRRKGASAWLCPRCSDARKARVSSRLDGDSASSATAAPGQNGEFFKPQHLPPLQRRAL
jgi:hypothetical protein